MKQKIRKSKYELKVKKSSTGLGLFSVENIKKNDFVIEYRGKMLSREQADRKGGKFLFEINSMKVIDGTARNNQARYINHSCCPNCETDIVKGKVYIYSIKNIKENEELNYDYGKEYYNDYIKPSGCKCNKCVKVLK